MLVNSEERPKCHWGEKMRINAAAEQTFLSQSQAADIIGLAQLFLRPGKFHEGRVQELFQGKGDHAKFPAFPAVHPLWRILLVLLIADSERRKVATSDIAFMVQLPSTSCLRYLNILSGRGMIVREPDPRDMRRIWLEISSAGKTFVSDALAAFLNDMGDAH